MRQRRYELLIDGDVFISETSGDQFRIVFDVIIDALGSISYADVALYNINQETINKALVRGSILSIRAGYDDSIDFIFIGKIRNIFKEKDGASTVCRIIARGGSLDKNVINIGLGENALLTDILESIASTAGYPLVITKSEFSQVYARGYKVTGDPFELLNKLSNAHNFYWTIENDRIIIVPENSDRKSTIQTINVFNGLEGIPEITEVGIDFAVRLTPKLKIGATVRVESEFKTFNYGNVYFQDVPENAGSGTYRMFKIKHSGDNYGSVWTTKVTGFSANAQERY